MDEFLGMAEIDEMGSEEPMTMDVSLFGKGKKEKYIEKPGKVQIEITSSDDLTAL